MFCSECGKKIPEEAQFCPACGTPRADMDAIEHALADESDTPSVQENAIETPDVADDADASATPLAAETDTPEATASAAGSPSDSNKSKRNKIIAIVVAVILICGAAGGFWWKSDQDAKAAQAAAEQAAWDAAHIKHAVVLNISAAGYDATTCSPIPVHVTGTDLDGNAVDEVQYIDGSGKGVQLMQGSYNVQAAASPLLAGGGIYDTPAIVIVIVVPADLDETAAITVPADQVIAFTPIAAIDITDDQIAAAKKYAMNSGMDQAKVDALVTAINGARSAAIAQKKAEEEAAAAAAAAEKARQEALAARTYTCQYFSVQVPESWGSNWTAEVHSGDKSADVPTTEKMTNYYLHLPNYNSGNFSIYVAKYGTTGLNLMTNDMVTVGTTSDGQKVVAVREGNTSKGGISDSQWSGITSSITVY